MSSSPSPFRPPLPASPALPSPPPSESFFSELDGTASVLEHSALDFGWDDSRIDPKSLNLVSWKLGIDFNVQDDINKRGFNAISTVLNHPTKKANPLRGSRKPLPPLRDPPPILPKPPPPSAYDPYLQTVTPLYDTLINAQASSSSSSGGEYDLQQPGRPDLPSLSSVPELFFDPDFDLGKPSTWEEVVGNAGPALKSRFSDNLDVLENHLVHEITQRSASFFSALSNLQDLQSESSTCLSRIAELQEALREVGDKQARKGLEIIDAQEELRILRTVEQNVKQIGDLNDMLNRARNVVADGDWATGLNQIGDIVNWWERHGVGEKGDFQSSLPSPTEVKSTSPPVSQSLPLSSLASLSTLPATVSEITSQISVLLEAALTAQLLAMLSTVEETPEFDKDAFKMCMEPLIGGLVRCGTPEALSKLWREVVITSIRDASRKHLPLLQSDEEVGEDGKIDIKGTSLVGALKTMDHNRFLLLTVQINSASLSRLERVQIMGELLQEVLTATCSLSPLTISNRTLDVTASLKTNPTPSLHPLEILTAGCEVANARASKILASRSDQHASLSLEEFVELFQINWEFILATETLAKRMIVPLRGVTATQARAFLVAYHAVRLTKSAKSVEDELWTQIDVPPSLQHIVDLLVQSAVSDPPECNIPPPPAITNGAAGPQKTLSIEERNFFVVRATMETLELLEDYLKIVINLELVVTDVMSRIVEFLKSFNSRTCQVVLGAGAMRSAGLKNITAKHLALASQSLSVVVALIPYIREFVRRHLSPKQAVMLTEFDKLKRDFQEHQNEIHAKLVAIMSDRLAVHCASLRDIDWESTSEKNGPSLYAELLVKETATLHKVLSKYLPAQTVESVMSEVLGAIVYRVGEEYKKVELKSEEAKRRMLQDATLITQRLSPLCSTDKTVTILETLVKDKPTPRKMSQTMAGLLRRRGSSSVKPAPASLEKEESIVDPGEDEEHALEDPPDLPEETPVVVNGETSQVSKEDSQPLDPVEQVETTEPANPPDPPDRGEQTGQTQEETSEVLDVREEQVDTGPATPPKETDKAPAVPSKLVGGDRLDETQEGEVENLDQSQDELEDPIQADGEKEREGKDGEESESGPRVPDKD
ncbi:hypothetical protein TREMEDRAFT_62628 [Tremella mesenterica DSM 1558]|uniref:uncharacterized protein n=1 Tax=Tremella mesenterica (strain ATCC 24925 / CBS 8224 / DSM 1558 / NBRC 9311 / NRRL Y-6157 / RJB 2259-6 / UBC 559-6) TaxID=578456 RepID=UPI0003F4949F|nr:uncharacterized protein TREMEDRAFT_62628 [Tremella mesenterica DSM 1558]EIW68910.1 hypothetical protein TREMEDRAFT_62628 [Tremella mesenterica DSM 1558]